MSDVVRIGDATLYHGDCLEILPTLDKVDAVVTDPPYGMAYLSAWRSEKHDAIAGDGDYSLLEWAFQIPVQHSRYVFCRWDAVPRADNPKSMIVWVKPNCGSGDLEHEHGRTTEYALFWPGPEHKWPQKRPWDVVRHPKAKTDRHPTEKPESLMSEFVGWTEGVVADPFMGSGTTGVACANLGRKFIGIELERKYFDIACERIDAAYSQGRLFA